MTKAEDRHETPSAEAGPTIHLFGKAVTLPRSRALRIAIGVVLMILGLFGFLPVLGFWMIPLGLLFVVLGVLRNRRKRAQKGPGPVGNPIQRAKALPRLWKAWRSGNYPELPRSQVVMWAVALVYLVSPIDIVQQVKRQPARIG